MDERWAHVLAAVPLVVFSRATALQAVGLGAAAALIWWLARNTQTSYRDTFCQLLPFAARAARRRIDLLRVEDLSAERVRAFLQDLEEKRGCGAATRNQAYGCSPARKFPNGSSANARRGARDDNDFTFTQISPPNKFGCGLLGYVCRVLDRLSLSSGAIDGEETNVAVSVRHLIPPQEILPDGILRRHV